MPSSSLGGIFFVPLAATRAAPMQFALPGGVSSHAPVPPHARGYPAPIFHAPRSTPMQAADRLAIPAFVCSVAQARAAGHSLAVQLR
ncbi:hypothetical protein ACFQ09_13440 [Massilia norwichensis]|jgi:hypothetical protein|uniref:Secreted protein n=1 Tax=Massilia norwichensis TaxID=1442366 RepID=A0ABT2A6D1_9BURK|nr:hypothetical protein [Massilia norwichensis]MCS0589739.1 hypothetical protein [Massilia norwichensis]